MDTEQLLNEIEKMANGIIRDINECDKVFLQASRINGLIKSIKSQQIREKKNLS